MFLIDAYDNVFDICNRFNIDLVDHEPLHTSPWSKGKNIRNEATS